MATLNCLARNPDLPEAALLRDYADLGVSTGYIGGIHTWGDDRAFRVFTRLRNARDTTGGGCMSVPVFDVPYGHKGVWQGEIAFDTPGVRAQLDALRARLQAGLVVLVA